MEKERICYFCKHVENDGVICPAYKCGKTGEKKESFDTCPEWEDYEEKGMIVHRFMSAVEFRRLMAGEVLENSNTHKGHKTSSVGFCFFTEPPHEAIHWLGGCVDCDYCVTMDIPVEMLTKTKGRYRDPKKHNPYETFISSSMWMERTEWCCRKYSNKEARVLNATPEFAMYSELRRELIKLGVIQP